MLASIKRKIDLLMRYTSRDYWKQVLIKRKLQAERQKRIMTQLDGFNDYFKNARQNHSRIFYVHSENRFYRETIEQMQKQASVREIWEVREFNDWGKDGTGKYVSRTVEQSLGYRPKGARFRNRGLVYMEYSIPIHIGDDKTWNVSRYEIFAGYKCYI